MTIRVILASICLLAFALFHTQTVILPGLFVAVLTSTYLFDDNGFSCDFLRQPPLLTPSIFSTIRLTVLAEFLHHIVLPLVFRLWFSLNCLIFMSLPFFWKVVSESIQNIIYEEADLSYIRTFADLINFCLLTKRIGDFGGWLIMWLPVYYAAFHSVSALIGMVLFVADFCAPWYGALGAKVPYSWAWTFRMMCFRYFLELILLSTNPTQPDLHLYCSPYGGFSSFFPLRLTSWIPSKKSSGK